MMLETDLSKLARWAIPGWVAILSFYGFMTIDILFSKPNGPHLFPTVKEFFGSMTTIDTALMAILVAAAGVPIGFLIYQGYFFLRWNSVFSTHGFLSPIFPGRLEDIKKAIGDLSNKELGNGSEWRERIINSTEFEQDHGIKWRYLELLFTEAAQKIDSKYRGVSIYSRHRYLMEVMHTLGSSIVAIYLGFGCYFLIKNQLEVISFLYHIILTSTCVFLLFLFLNFENHRKKSISNEETSESAKIKQPIIIVDSPASVFLFSFAIFLFFLHPIINQNYGGFVLFIRVFISLIMIIVWTISKENSNKAVRFGIIFPGVFIITLLVILRFFPLILPKDLDWPFIVSLFVFLIGNIILFQNRDNTVKDMSGLEYYTLRRLLSDEDYQNIEKYTFTNDFTEFDI